MQTPNLRRHRTRGARATGYAMRPTSAGDSRLYGATPGGRFRCLEFVAALVLDPVKDASASTLTAVSVARSILVPAGAVSWARAHAPTQLNGSRDHDKSTGARPPGDGDAAVKQPHRLQRNSQRVNANRPSQYLAQRTRNRHHSDHPHLKTLISSCLYSLTYMAPNGPPNLTLYSFLVSV